MAVGNTGLYNRYTGPVTDRAEYEDALGGQDISPAGRGGSEEDVIRYYLDLLQGQGNQYVPDSPGGIIGPGGPGPEGDFDPQDFISQQLAGDVLPMRTHPPSISDVNMRLQSPGVGARSQGMQTIDRFGKDPRILDLMDVLMGRFGK
jgi:hypothetical protein